MSQNAMEQINLRRVVEDWHRSRDLPFALYKVGRTPLFPIDMTSLHFTVQNLEWKMKTGKPTVKDFSRDVRISNNTCRPALAAILTDLSSLKSVKFVLRSATLKGVPIKVPLALHDSLPQEVLQQFVDQTDIDLGQLESETSGDAETQRSTELTLSCHNSTARLIFQEKTFKADFSFNLAVTGYVRMPRGNTIPFPRIVNDMMNKPDAQKNLNVREDQVLIPVEGRARFRWTTVNCIEWD